MEIGYVRVSTVEQNTARQLDGVQVSKIFEDKASGKSKDRPELKKCMAYIREGDTLHVHSMDRLARNLDDLRSVVKDLTARGVVVQFHKEGLRFTGDDSPMATLLLSVMGAVAEFERSLLLERQAEGIALAKQEGKYKGRKPVLNADQAADLCCRVAAGESKAAVGRAMGIGRSSVYAYLAAGSPLTS